MKVLFITSTYTRHDTDTEDPWQRRLVRCLNDSGRARVDILAPSYRGMKDHVIDGAQVRRFRYFIQKRARLNHGLDLLG